MLTVAFATATSSVAEDAGTANVAVTLSKTWTDQVTVKTTSPTTGIVRPTTKRKPSVPAPAATAQDSSSQDTTAAHQDSSSSQKSSSTGRRESARHARAAS